MNVRGYLERGWTIAGEAFSIPSFDCVLPFCFILPPVMENELCGQRTVFQCSNVIPPIESSDSNTAPRIRHEGQALQKMPLKAWQSGQIYENSCNMVKK
jgi:hypothetical protein